MVQRKLTLQLDHAKAQSFSHHHDAKSPRGADLKAKKMKKSGRPATPPPPPLCKTPNYMKSTSSSDARKEQSQSSGKKATKREGRTLIKKPSFKAARKSSSPVVVCEAQRATCSSTLKDSKFPAFLSLNPTGTSAVKVCPYTYCSLNSHHHPPLNSFLSERRRAIKTQKRCLPAGDDDFNNNDFFLEIYGAGIDETAPQDQEVRVCDDFDASAGQNQEVLVEEEFFIQSVVESTQNVDLYEQDSCDGSDMEWETGYCSPLQFDYEADVVDIKDEFTDGKDCCFDEFLVDEVSQESFDEEGFSSDAFSSSDDGELFDDLQISSPPLGEGEEEEEEECKTPTSDHEASFDECEELIKEESAEAEHGIFSNPKGENEEDINLLKFRANSKKKVVQDGDELGDFNPRAPNFLTLEDDPEAEKVDLRHQDVDERRNSEEWMVDYALRQVVTKLGPARKRKVALLVEAFEKVMPPTKFDLHLGHASAFDQPRPIQACS